MPINTFPPFIFKLLRVHTYLLFCAGIDVFNFNYDVNGNTAKKRYIPLFGDGDTSRSGLPTGFSVGCLDCYAYAGIVFKFK
jgi:hypothetical protein